MITSFTTVQHEEYKFKTAEAARAFCRVHPECFSAVGNDGYSAMRGFGIIIGTDDIQMAHYTSSVSASYVPYSAVNQFEQKIAECKFSYKNIITAGMLGSLTGTKYKMGNGDISHPIIFTYGLGVAAPEFTLWLLVCLMLSLVFGFSFLVPAVLGVVVVAAVEVLIPWINSYNVDPIEEPWMVPKLLDDIRNG